MEFIQFSRKNGILPNGKFFWVEWMVSRKHVCPSRFSALLLALLFILVPHPTRAEDCWSQVAEAADPDLTVTVSSTEILTVRELLARGQELTPPMMIMKALAGIDHFMRNPQCLPVYTESLALLDSYIVHRTNNKGDEWNNDFAAGYPAAAASQLAHIRKQSDALIADGNAGLVPEMILNVDQAWQKTIFYPLLSVFDRYDLEQLTLPCRALRKSMLWSSALVTRTWRYSEITVVNAEWCRFEGLNLTATAAYQKASSGYNTGENSGTHSIITDPRGQLGYSPPSAPPAWAYFSAWNWLEWRKVESLFAPALEELSGFYQSDAGLSDENARAAAFNALVGLQRFERTLPPPFGDIRVFILLGRPISEIAVKYRTIIKDGFDSCDFRQLDRNIFNIQNSSAEDDDSKCFFDNALTYRWEEHLALIGTPEPPLLISVLRSEVVAWLLDVGEDIEQVNQYGKTVLMTAAHLNQVETLRLLLQRGADVNRRSYGEIKVDLDSHAWAERMYLSDTIRKPRSLRHAGRTALMYAAENADAEIIDLLLSAGADPCLADSKGLVPADYFDGRAPSGQSNTKVTDNATRDRLLAALACPEEKRMLPAPFVAPTTVTP